MKAITNLCIYFVKLIKITRRHSNLIINWLILFVITIVFKRRISNFIADNSFFTDKDVRAVDPSIAYLVCITLFCVFLWLILKNYKFSRKANFIFSYIFVLYIILRNDSTDNLWFSKFIFNGFFYVDIIGLFFILYGLLYLRNLLFSNFTFYDDIITYFNSYTSATKNDIAKSLLEDIPLSGDIENDNEPIIDELINSLSDLKPKQPFIIGVNSIWGIGKTSFLLRLENKIFNSEKKDSRPILFWFNAWQHQDEKSIINNFFSQLKKELSKYNGNASNSINTYLAHLLGAIDNKILTNINSSINSYFSSVTTLQDSYQEINNIIEAVDRKIIIFVDDIDRLNKTEILEILRILRNIARFQNIIFICALDREYVVRQSQIEDNYLDKIFNLEVPLIRVNSNAYKNLLFQLIKANEFISKDLQSKIIEVLNSIFTSDDIFPFEDVILQDEGNYEYAEVRTVQLVPSFFFESRRDIKKFLNELLFNLRILGEKIDSINLEHYILLRLVLYRYKWIYKIFSTKKLTAWLGSGTTLKFNFAEFEKNLIGESESLDKQIIATIFKSLFPPESSTPGFGAINQRRYFSFYLNNNAYNDSFSLTDLKHAIEKKDLSGLLTEDINSYEDKNLLRADLVTQILAKENISSAEIYNNVIELIKTPEVGYVTDIQVLDIIHLGETVFRDTYEEILKTKIFTNLHDNFSFILIQLNRIYSTYPQTTTFKVNDIDNQESRKKINDFQVLTKSKVDEILLSLATNELKQSDGINKLLAFSDAFVSTIYDGLNFYLLSHDFKVLLIDAFKNDFENLFLNKLPHNTHLKTPRLIANIFESEQERDLIDTQAKEVLNSHENRLHIGSYITTGMNNFYDFCVEMEDKITLDYIEKYKEFMLFFRLFKDNNYLNHPTIEQINRAKVNDLILREDTNNVKE